MHDGTNRTVYVLAGEYSQRPGAPDGDLTQVFEKARREAADEKAGDHGRRLEALMLDAGRRAIASTGLGARCSHAINHLLVTTMPDLEGEISRRAINLPNRLKRSLALSDRCQARLEIGSSDAGAALFASAVRQLRGLDAPATALVVAGQVIPGGRRAIDTVAQVLEEAERSLGLTMIGVGDMLVDLYGHWLRQEARGQAWSEGARVAGRPRPPADDEPTQRAHVEGLLRDLVLFKLGLAHEYRAAQRFIDPAVPASLQRQLDEHERSRPMGRWMRGWHTAQASNGACAVLLTTDEGLVRDWMADRHQRRIVRVLGVGEGDADPRVTMRAEPFAWFRAVRQALVEVRRSTGTNDDFLRASAFAVLHDAFPSIELAFLLSLGFGPFDAARRSRSYWPNPYGGLTAFGHALAASGLVQIAKALHVLLRQAPYIRTEPPTQHIDWTRAAEPVHCLTTSVGGPLSHVVATLLEACPVVSGSGELAAPFDPPARHRHGPDAPDDFEARTRWIGRVAARYRAALAGMLPGIVAPGHYAGVVEARTELDLRTMMLPLPARYVAAWRPTPERWQEAGLAPEALLTAEALLRRAIAGASSTLCRTYVVEAALLVSEAHLAAGHAPAAGRRDLINALRLARTRLQAPEEHGLTRDEAELDTRRALRRIDRELEKLPGPQGGATVKWIETSLWSVLRPAVASVTGVLPHLRGEQGREVEPVRGLCLLDPEAVDRRGELIGRLVELAADPAGGPYPLAVAVLPESTCPGLVPPWYRPLGAPGDLRHLRERLAGGALAADGPHDVPHREILGAPEGETSPPGEAAAFAAPAELGAPEPVDVDALVGDLAREGPTAAVMRRVFRVATVVVDELLAHPERTPPAAAVQLLHELVLRAEPGPWRLRDALQALFPAGLPAGAETEVFGYCEINVIGALALQGDDLGRIFGTLSAAVAAAEGWLAGASIDLGRVADSLSVVVRNDVKHVSWANLARFARDVYRAALDAGVAVRAAVCIGPGVPFREAHGGPGLAGVVQKAAHLVLEESDYFRRPADKGARARRDGIATVLVGSGWHEDTARQRCQAIWSEVGYEEFETSAFGRMETPGHEPVYYHVVRATFPAKP
jgi:hypothetical protein